MEKQVKISREMMYYTIRFNSIELYRMYLYIQNHPNFYVDSDGRRSFAITALASELGIARKTAYIHLEKLLKQGWLRYDTKQEVYFISSHKRLIKYVRTHIGCVEWGQIEANLNRDNYKKIIDKHSTKSKMYSMKWDDFTKFNSKKELKNMFLSIFVNENIKQQIFHQKKKHKNFGEIVNRKQSDKTVKNDFQSFVSGIDVPSRIHLSVNRVSEIFSKKSVSTGHKYRKDAESVGFFYTRTNGCFLGKNVNSHFISEIREQGFHVYSTDKGWYVNGASFIFPCQSDKTPFTYFSSNIKL